MKSIKQIYNIDASVQEVWQALIDSKVIDKWGGGPSKMSDKVGFEFELWGGEIHGKNIEVIPEKLLVQEWFSGNWDKPSIAKFVLSSKGSETRIDFSQIDVPDAELSDIEEGWRDYYIGPLKDYLENNRT